jgi:protein-S-isoprenylcysteine O-methyltransferase Ste14
MTPQNWIRIAWVVLAVIWGAAALATKRTSRRQSTWSLVFHVAAIAVAFNLLFADYSRLPVLDWRLLPAMPWAGLALVLAGTGFAIWARFYLGGNWSGTVTVKQNHTLVRGGPYRIVRHPIYSGLSLAILGTALSNGELRGFIALVVAVASWKHKSLIEEGFMVEQFGRQYEAYRAEVKGLVPWVW